MQILLIMLIVVLLAFSVLLLALAKQSPREKQTEDKEQEEYIRDYAETVRQTGGSMKKLEHWKVIAIYLIIYDMIAVNFSYFMALLVRFDFRYSSIPTDYFDAWRSFAPIYEVYIFALQIRKEHLKRKRTVGNNVKVIPIMKASNKTYLLYSFRTLTDINLYKEFARLVKSRRLSVRNFVNMFVYFSRSHYEADLIDKKMKGHVNKESIFYSYRFEYQPYVAMLLKKKWKLNSKIVSRAHRYDLYEEEHKGNYIPMREGILSKIDNIYPCSDHGTDYLRKRFPQYKQKVHTRFLGTIDHGEKEYLFNDKCYEIVSCSTVTKVKRLDLLINALSQIKTIPIKWTHYGDGILMDEIKKMAKDKLRDNIQYEFKGNVSNTELMKQYQDKNYYVFVNVSSSEGIPVSIMEATSFGIPCIATDAGGTKEIISDSFWSLCEALANWTIFWVDTFIVGNYFSEYQLGLYKNSTNMVQSIMGMISASMSPVLLSTLSRLKNNPEKYKKAFLNIHSLIIYLVAPMGIGLFLYRKMATLLLFGSKWGEASNIVGAWGLMMMCSVIFYSFPAELYKSKGIPQMLFLSQCIYLLFMIPICVVTAKFGFWIMVYSRCGAIIIQMIIGIVFMKKFFEIDLQDYFKSFLYPLIATIAMILISEVTKWYLKGIIGDFIGILVCVLVYLAVVYVVARKQLLNIIQTIKKEKV